MEQTNIRRIGKIDRRQKHSYNFGAFRAIFPHRREKDIQRILDFPVTVQINAGSLLDWKQRSKIVKMFKHNKAHLLGSDCHGMHHRPPNLLQGRDMLEKKAGREVLDRIDALGEKILL